MAKADLTAQRLRELLDYDPETGVFTWRVPLRGIRVGQVAACKGKHGYIVIRVDRILYLAHRLAWLYVYGEWPLNKIDHKNRQRSDNRIANLRDASDTINGQNVAVKEGTAGTDYIGRGRSLKRHWAARILANGVRYSLGCFETQEEAHQAYLEAKRRLHEGCTI